MRSKRTAAQCAIAIGVGLSEVLAHHGVALGRKRREGFLLSRSYSDAYDAGDGKADGSNGLEIFHRFAPYSF